MKANAFFSELKSKRNPVGWFLILAASWTSRLNLPVGMRIEDGLGACFGGFFGFLVFCGSGGILCFFRRF
jgi:hypothetical protein